MIILRTIINLELFTYSIVGGLTALIYFGILALCLTGFNLNYLLAVSLGYLCSVCFHFFANRKFTFQVSHNNISSQLIRYLCLLITNYIITLGIVYVLVNNYEISTYLSVCLSIIVTLGTGFCFSKFWVFRK